MTTIQLVPTSRWHPICCKVGGIHRMQPPKYFKSCLSLSRWHPICCKGVGTRLMLLILFIPFQVASHLLQGRWYTSYVPYPVYPFSGGVAFAARALVHALCSSSSANRLDRKSENLALFPTQKRHCQIRPMLGLLSRLHHPLPGTR